MYTQDVPHLSLLLTFVLKLSESGTNNDNSPWNPHITISTAEVEYELTESRECKLYKSEHVFKKNHEGDIIKNSIL